MTGLRAPVAVAVVAALVIVASSCGQPDDVAVEDDQRSRQGEERVQLEPVTPEAITQPVPYGEQVAAPNTRWYVDSSAPPVLIHDGEDWYGLPQLPESVASIGVVTVGSSLFVTAIRCDASVDCSVPPEERGESYEGNLAAWRYTGLGDGYVELDLPDDLRVPSDSLTSAGTGSYAALTSSDGPVIFAGETATVLDELSIDTSGPTGFQLAGDRIAVVRSDGAGQFSSIQSVPIDQPSSRPIEVAVPDSVSGSFPYFIDTQALWIEGALEVVLDTADGTIAESELPPEVQAVAGTQDALGAPIAAVGANGRFFLYPSGLTQGSPEGTVAIRNEDGVWTLQSAQPALPGSVVSGTEVPTVVESDGTVRTVG